jgi:hypothetical protein
MESYQLSKETLICDEQTTIINIDKCRLGQIGEFPMIFNGACSRFEDHNYKEYIETPVDVGSYKPVINEEIPF